MAAERGETVGGTVGYQIRLERRASEHTKLLFVTTGILLRRLQADPQLEGVTHVILDEVRCVLVFQILTGTFYFIVYGFGLSRVFKMVTLVKYSRRILFSCATLSRFDVLNRKSLRHT